MGGVEREYIYQTKWTFIIVLSTLSGLATAGFGVMAARNDQGLRIDEIELGPTGASAFYWLMCALGAGFVVIGVLLVYHRLTFHQRIAFTPTTVVVPVSRWSREEMEILYRDILALATNKVYGQRFLYVEHVGGKYTIDGAMLPSKAAFAEIRDLLASRAEEASRIEA